MAPTGTDNGSMANEIMKNIYDSSNTAVRVNVVTGSSIVALSTFGSAVPSSGLYVGFNDGTNLRGATVFDLDSGGGTQYVIGTSLRFAASGGSVAASGLTVGSTNALSVAIVDGSGAQITTFGGGTQYTEADTDSTITGTVMMMEGAANVIVAAPGSAADGLLVNLGTNNDVTVTSGSITAVQPTGTNLHMVVDSGTITTLSTITNVVHIDDNASTITVDAPQGTPVFVRLSDGTNPISTLAVSLASVPSHAVTNAGTFAVQVDGNALTSLQLIDDIIFVDDAAFTPATSKIAAMGAFADEASTDSVDEGDLGVLRMTLDRRLRIANKTMDGPGEPIIDSYTHLAINLAAGADQVLVASAANKQVWVYGITITVNVAGTASFQDEDNVAISGIIQLGTTGGFSVAPSGNFAMPMWKCATDKDLEVDVVTSELDGFLEYALVSV